MAELRLQFRQPSTQISASVHYTLAASAYSPEAKGKTSSRQVQVRSWRSSRGKYPWLCSPGEMSRAKEGEAKWSLNCKGTGSTGHSEQTSAVLLAAYYQPSLTAEYDEDSPGGDFDFFSNLVTKWEAAARLPGDSTRQVVVRSGESPRTWKLGRAE